MQGQRRDKGQDKPVADPRREYLDEEFSDDDEATEEKSGLDDEFNGNLSRATYAEKELDKLVHHVMEFTTLSGLVQDDWNNECISSIGEFFLNPRVPVLTVYFQDDVLTARLSFPEEPVDELNYFIRKPFEIFTPEEFHSTVLFGSINDNVEVSILAIINNILSPIFTKVNLWPDSVKEDFCTNVQSFLCNLTDLRYKMLGLTVIYQPRESELTAEEASTDKELVKRLEGIVVHWSRQIRIALGDQDQSAGGELLSFKDEYDFWIYRYDNLRGLSQQLETRASRRLLDILAEARSTHLRQLQSLVDEIRRAIEEAESNVQFLDMLSEPCAALDACGQPIELHLYLSKIIQLSRVLWINSSYLGTERRITRLFELIGNQVMAVCRRALSLPDMFSGKTRKTMSLLTESIAACQRYKELYDKISRAHNKLTHHKWELKTEQVFRYINVFVVRCHNLIEISQSMIDFARMDETRYMPRMKFGGTNGPKHEEFFSKIECRLHNLISWLCEISPKILDVRQSTWYDDMSFFRREIRKLEVAVENLMEEVFKEAGNVEEAVQALHSFRYLMEREHLQKELDNKRASIWQYLEDEIRKTKQEMIREKSEYPGFSPYFGGQALNLQGKACRLKRLSDLLRECTWQRTSSGTEAHSEAFHHCDGLVQSIGARIGDLYRKWLADVGDNPQSWLDRYLMRRGPDKSARQPQPRPHPQPQPRPHPQPHPRQLRCDVDPRLPSLCREARYWLDVHLELPANVQLINGRWRSLQFVLENVLAIVGAYNSIVRALSADEQALFRELTRELDRRIQPGLRKLTWNSEYIEDYIKDCNAQTAKLQEFLDTYKQCNIEIFRICENICSVSMIKIRHNYAFQLDELLLQMENARSEAGDLYFDSFKEIIQYLLVVFEGFQRVIEQSLPEWKLYLLNFDRLLKEAFKLSIKNSLSIMYEALHGDGTTSPTPFLQLNADLLDNKVNFCPSLKDVARMVSEIFYKLLDVLKRMTRVVEKFELDDSESEPFWSEYTKDEDLDRSRQMLNNEVSYCFSQVQNYLTTWEPFRDIWEVNKDLFIQRYEKLKPTVASFDADITRYAEVANNVQMQETVVTVHFLEINADRLKAAIIEQCNLWQTKLTSLLLRMTEAKVNQVYKYVADNSKKITKEPTDLISMQDTLQLFERLTAEISREEKEFPKIRQQYETLEKYEVPMALELKRKIRDIDDCWASYLELIAACEDVLMEKKEEFKNKLVKEDVLLRENIIQMLQKFNENAPFTAEWKTKAARSWLNNFHKKVNGLKDKLLRLKRDLTIFSISQHDSPELNLLLKNLSALEVVWDLADQWARTWERYKSGNFWSIEIDDMGETVGVLFRKLTRLCRELKDNHWAVVDATRLKVDKFRRTLPLITDLKNPSMRDRHWKKVMQTIGREFDQSSDEFTLDAIAEMQMFNFADEIADISNAATMELGIEMGLNSIKSVWKEMPLTMVPYKDNGVFRLKTVDDIIQALEDHQVQLSAMKSTKFVEAFALEVDYWERALSTVGEILEMVLSVQKGYMYLDNIFSAEDIRQQLPEETKAFDKLTDSWKRITGRMAASGLALDATHNPPGLFNVLNNLNNKLEVIQRELEQYLETKRHVFPRFYFISNDDLLEILANSKKPESVQPHIKKLFEGIKNTKLGKSASGKTVAEGMSSSEGEYVEFLRPVILEGQVEIWLCYIESAMRDGLRELLRQCRAALRKMSAKRDKWVKEWQSQPGITSTQIQWTTDCTRVLLQCKMIDSKKPLKKLKRRQNQALTKYSEAVRGNLDRLQRLKFKAIVVIEIHARDVIEKMYKSNCRDVSAFEWLSQLRFYWDRDIDDCIVRQTNTSFVYGYEYLGNSERLVITPLTDRCYITLTTALHLHRGGSPKGPAGTGKTETVKDLGKALGFNVIVVNCSEGLDYKSMGRMFSGLAQTGAWGCFDEFNRINIEVLSVVAQQILSILTALSQKSTRFVFEGIDISLVHTCGVFITMNPGYAGRTELPDNLKSMFRPISMMVPDSSMIAEMYLFGEGFQNTRSLAKKVDTLYALAKQQLSKQFHYDFGLRGIVTLTRYAGRKRRAYPHLPDDEVVILAMKDMNLAKLTTDDLPLFLGITSDLFPGIQVPTVDYAELVGYITKEATKLKLQPIPSFVKKVIELYETKNSRHSSMIVGQSNTGKSVTWRTLQNTLTTMKKDGKPGFQIVHEFPLNPKALNLGELYGEYNLSTGEWADGVISSIMRKTCADESPDEKWIVFDGPVDAVWIENMNSVMDDNKILTLINNDRITLPEQVSLLFEVEDLAVASPATVSRAGMVYCDYKDLGWRPYVASWLQKFPKQPEFVEEMNNHFDKYVEEILEFKRSQCNELVRVPEPNAVQSLCKLLEVLATPQNGVELLESRDAFNSMCKLWFLFCMIWSLCASVDEEGRQKMDNFVREMEGGFPLRDTIYEYYVDVRQRGFVSWEEKLSQSWKFPPESPFYKIIVPTVDTVRYEYLVNVLLNYGHPVLLVGPVGTGKTSTAHSVVNSLDRLKYSLLILNMSGQTSSANVQEAIESRVEKRTKGIYVPVGGKTMIAYMDDFNMPMKDTYGSQPPLELIRQLMAYGFWYDRQNQSRKYIQKMQVMGAMGPPGGGRNIVTDRLLSQFNVINMTFPTEKQIVRIYGTMLNQQLLDFHQEVKGLANDVTMATLAVYKSVVINMLPTPMKMHYLFNLRDISKVFQGLLRSHKDYQYSKQTFLRLWIHENFRVFCDRLVDDQDREWFLTSLNEQLGQFFETTFSSLCPEKKCPIFGGFMNAWNIYEDLKDVGSVRSYAESQMDEHNATAGVVRLHLVLFRDAVEHICRIVRVISEPRGNMLLVGIGGSGRQSLSRLAAYMCELTSFQVEVSKNYQVLEFREDLKSLYYLAGVENKPSSFLFNDTQIVEEQFLEIVNNILSTGEIANLFKSDELEDIKNKLAKDAAKAKIAPTSEAMYLFLIQRVRENLHVILCMSPIGEAFRNRLRQYPALINFTSIDWFHEWPRDALLEVGNKFLMNLDFTLTITGDTVTEEYATGLPAALVEEKMRDAIASTFSLIHGTVSQFSRRMSVEMKRYNYVTPTNFLELVAGYKQMLGEKREDLSEQANKLRNGLFKLDDTKEKVNEMAAELAVTQQQVQRSSLECEEFLVSIVSQRRDADETQKLVTARSVKIADESKVCKKLEEIARADLASVEPALEEAMMALDALSKKDISEIKSFTRPPAKVEMVLEAVMILKNSEPSWTESKRQLGDVNFINTLRDFDKDHISDKTLRTIGKYTSDPEFEPEKVGIVSTAAKSLCMWVIAMEQYGKLYRIVAPKRAKLEAALSSLGEKQAALAEASAQLQKLREELKRLQQMYDAKMKEKEDLINLEALLKLKLERAAMLVDGLSGERVRWESSVQELNGLFDSLPGDCLIATAFVSYLGPFVSNYRDELVQIWIREVREQEIPTSRNFDVKAFLGDPTTIREWNIQGLPSDDFSTENGIIITRGSRWPLVIDPQNQAAKWIRNMEMQNSLKIIDFGQLNFPRILEHAIQFGKPVLLENVGETLEPVMESVLQKAFIKSGNQIMIKFNDKMITFNEKFRLFMTTKLPNPHYAPEISTKTTLCNFAIKEQGLEAQLLGIVVRKEKPQLEEQKDNLVLTIATGKRTLKELEDKILYLLSVTAGSLLDDLNLLTTLQTSKSTAITIQDSLVVSEETEKEIDSAREGYRPCSRRAALLFFVLTDMSLIDPMYQFSLDAYVSLFNISIDKSPKSSDLAERIDALNNYHTYALYRNTCRGLFEQHKLLFSFHMCMKILEAQNKVISAEYGFLLTGGIVLDRESQPDKPVDWLPDECWDNITELDKLPGFHSIIMSFEQMPRDWRAWYVTTEPENELLVGEWEEQCNEFQKMLIVRSCRPDRTTSCLRNYIVNNLGPAFVEPPVLDVRAVLEDSTERTPLIFVLSPGVDPTGALMQLADHYEMGHRFMTLSLGQGQAPIATRMIELGSKEGAWVFLANCHLSLSWMPKLDKIVENLGSSKTVHPEFRLWLSSSPTPQFPISILQAGIKMTTEPPKGLKANMKRLYGLISETQFDICNAKSKYKKLLFALVFFHSILLERKKFQQLGWNVVYSFNDSDFEVSENLLQVYLDEYPETPWDALKYLIAGICYGGHVTDDWDRRLLLAYLEDYMNDSLLKVPQYRLSPLATYHVPRDGSLESYRDFVNLLPMTDRPEAFGQHPNADIASLIVDARLTFESLLSLQVQAAESDESESPEDRVSGLAQDIMSKLPREIDYERTERLIGSRKRPLDVVLLQEILRYNELLRRTRRNLEELCRAIRGLVVMSSELEDTFTCVQEGRVPQAWSRTFPSLKGLAAWTRDLVHRVQHFAKWADSTRPPLLFWLAAFTFPTGFLTAVLQTEARRSAVSIDSLSWEFAVFKGDDEGLVDQPEIGVNVRSMFLEGAGWDKQLGALIDPAPMQLVYNMPVVHFKPTEQIKKKTRALYNCPCYYYPQRCGDQGRPAYVVTVDLNAGAENSAFWTKRGTALLLSLAS